MWWQLTALGVACDVVAPTLVLTKAGDRIKTDRRDAMKLARSYRAGDLTPVWVLDAAHEALRDLVTLGIVGLMLVGFSGSLEVLGVLESLWPASPTHARCRCGISPAHATRLRRNVAGCAQHFGSSPHIVRYRPACALTVVPLKSFDYTVHLAVSHEESCM
jgi:hypothetical protein